jgi:DNA gyrase subunit A
VIRVPVEGIRVSGRNTQGVKVMNLTPGDLVVDVARIVREDDDEAEDDAGDEDTKPKDAKPKGAKSKGRATPAGKKQ